jgi:UDP-N-acetylmuramyl tripeptide synthase
VIPSSLVDRVRLGAAVAAGKIAGEASRRLGRGGGATISGLVAGYADPQLICRLGAQLGQGSVLVTATNGKTTTARLTAALFEAGGLPVVHNRTGSNMMRGVAAALLEPASLAGTLPHGGRSVGVFEIDEVNLPLAAEMLQPRQVAILNLFRDQLDRYGEVDKVMAEWRRALRFLPADATLVLNADDPTVASLGDLWSGPCTYFGVDDVSQATPRRQGADARWCENCGSAFRYEATFYWHIGHWRCTGCGRQRPSPAVSASKVEMRRAGLDLTIETSSGALQVGSPLSGLYNVYNLLAAASVGLNAGLSPALVAETLSSASAAFGRQETLQIDGREVQVMLAKNPAGVNQIIQMLRATRDEIDLVVVLNDNLADGTDVSWIWDVDWEDLAGRARSLIASGSRAEDLALRLTYAGLTPQTTPDLRQALDEGVRQAPAGGELIVLPNYTAMLEAREYLALRAGQGHYWEKR